MGPPDQPDQLNPANPVPLGVTPERLWKEHRIRDLIVAAQRAATHTHIDTETWERVSVWLREAKQLADDLRTT